MWNAMGLSQPCDDIEILRSNNIANKTMDLIFEGHMLAPNSQPWLSAAEGLNRR